ncbi:MAG: Smr/MutS family protein [Deltaproteobacteria bacterium]|nr:Smr/MutS family protein [Deltaproteobacteria bacterium]
MIPQPQLESAHAPTLNGLEWGRLLEALSKRLQGTPGREALAALAFLDSPREAMERMELIGEMKVLRRERGALVLAAPEGVALLVVRAAKEGRLEAEEMGRVLEAQRMARKVGAEMRALLSLAEAGEIRGMQGLPGLAALAGVLKPEEELCRTLEKSLDPGGGLNLGAFPELRGLLDELEGRRRAIQNRLERILRDTALENALQDRIYTLRGRRYVVPVKADFKGQFKGIVHDVSASGATLFMEPQAVVEDTNALTMAERQLEMEMDRILRELSALVGKSAPALQENLRWLGGVDLLHAQARLSEDYQGSGVLVQDGGEVSLKGLAHPLMLLEEQAAAREKESPVVRNDLDLGGDRRCMVISGANTGGKTVLLKAVGMCALLARCGMHLPVREGSRFDLFGRVWADIGDMQSLESDLSTFSAQISLLAEVLPAADRGSLVLLDEMLTGTDPAQGAALAGAVLERLVRAGALTLVTTHFGELKTLAERLPEVLNASVSFDPERLRPTFRLLPGVPGASYGLLIARRHGLPEELARAAELELENRPAALDTLLIRLQEREAELVRLEQNLEQRRSELARERKRLEEERRTLEGREQEVRHRERGEISAEVRQTREKIAGVIKELQQANSLQTVDRVRRRLDEVSGELPGALQIAADEPEPGLKPAGDLEKLGPGTRLWLGGHSREVELEAPLDKGRRARVRMGGVSLEVDGERLFLVPTGTSPKPSRQAGASSRGGRAARRGGEEGAAAEAGQPPPVLPGGENTLDMRGLRLHEALERLEPFLDLCVMKHVSPVLLIHGHGTGALKKGLREALGGSPYVSSFRPGERNEGGDGVTVAALEL